MKQRLAFCALFLFLFVLAWPSMVESVGRVLNLTDQGTASFYEARANGVNKISLQAASSLAGDVTFTLPIADGTNGQFLKTDGSAAFGWGNSTAASLDSAYDNGATVTVDAGAITLTGSGTVIDIEGSTTIKGPIPFVDVTAYGTNSAAFDSALATISSGGILYVPAGAYTITTRVDLTGDDIAIVGAGQETVISSGAGVVLFYAEARNRLTFRNLRFSLGHAAYAINLEGGTSGEVYDWTIENVDVTTATAAARGFRIASDLGTANINRVLVRNCRLVNTAAVPTEHGLSIGGGLGVARDIFVDGCFTEGWEIGFNFANNAGGNEIQRGKIYNSTFKDAYTYGGRFYHGGETIFSGCLFTGCEVGAWFDNGSGNRRTVVDGCRFTDNDIAGLMTEEWQNGVLSDCIVTGNGEVGVWLNNMQECTISGCTISGNTKIGVLGDYDASYTGTSTTVYAMSHTGTVRDCTFTGCVISKNGENGIQIQGTGRSFNMSGCTVTRNGTSSASPAAGSGFADVYIDKTTAGGSNGILIFDGCSFGNSTANGAADDGKSQYGIFVAQSAYSLLQITNCYFAQLEDAIQATSTATVKIVTGCTFFICNDINFSAGKPVFFGNTIDSGTLDGSSWDGRWSVGTDQGNIDFQEAVDMGSTLTVDGASTLTGAVTASAAVTITGTLTANGAVVANDKFVMSNDGELTIATGAITVTGSHHTVDTQNDDATDSLDTINGGTAGQLIILRAANPARSVVVVSTSDNIELSVASFDLDHTDDVIMLFYDGATWLEVAKSDNTP